MKKSEALHRQSSTPSDYTQWVKFKETQSINENPITFENERSQQEAFRQFLQKREVSMFLVSTLQRLRILVRNIILYDTI